MGARKQKTYQFPTSSDAGRWVIVNLENQVLGRAASKIADILRGKHKATYTPFIDSGDWVVVINAEKVALTGNKMDEKVYYHHTGFPGGIKAQTAEEVKNTHPERLIEWAVKGMLPKSHFAKQLLTKLKVYAGSEHPHAAQNPKPIPLS